MKIESEMTSHLAVVRNLLQVALNLMSNRIGHCSCKREDECWQCKEERDLCERIEKFLGERK